MKKEIENIVRQLRDDLLKGGFKGALEQNIPLATYTTYGIGGPGALIVTATDIFDLELLNEHLKRSGLPSFVLGGGANVLISDDGYPGAVIRLGGKFAEYESDGTTIKTGSSVPLTKIVREGCRIGMRGIERLAGIPGWVGGAVVMNAGTYGEHLDGLLDSVEVIDENGHHTSLAPSQCGFAYRTSRFQDSFDIILGCMITGVKGDPELLASIVKDRIEKRNASQPISHPSCGCVFRNPPGDKSAGLLLQEAGMKGARHGRAVISDLHANFIINEGGASASDILRLMANAKKKVKDLTGLDLVPEVRGFGFEKPIGELLDADIEAPE